MLADVGGVSRQRLEVLDQRMRAVIVVIVGARLIALVFTMIVTVIPVRVGAVLVLVRKDAEVSELVLKYNHALADLEAQAVRVGQDVPEQQQRLQHQAGAYEPAHQVVPIQPLLGPGHGECRPPARMGPEGTGGGIIDRFPS